MQDYKLLLIENDDVDAAQVLRAFQGHRKSTFTVDRVDTIAAACRQVFQADYDVILLDMGLPESTGLVNVERLVSLLDIPIIVLTGNEDLNVADQAIELGAQDYILKSEHVASVLTRAVRYAIERYRTDDTLNRTRELLNAHCSITKQNDINWDSKLEVAGMLAVYAENTRQSVAIINCDCGITWANNSFYQWFGLQQMPRNVSMTSPLSLVDLSTTAADSAWIDQVKNAIAHGTELHCHLLMEDSVKGLITFRLEVSRIPERVGSPQAFALSFSEDDHSDIHATA